MTCTVLLTRKVALSNSSTSSASRMLAKLLRLSSNWFTLGISKWTMFDHACRCGGMTEGKEGGRRRERERERREEGQDEKERGGSGREESREGGKMKRQRGEA